MARIATIYSARFRSEIKPCAMNTVRWLRISESLARRGHKVDIVINTDLAEIPIAENLRYVSADRVNWNDYDVVKTEFHQGFDYLEALGGADHPFIISKLGSVVGHHDEVPGVYFFDRTRAELFETQQRIAQKSRFITILTRESIDLWEAEHGSSDNVLLLPTGVDRITPAVTENPYADFPGKTAVYIGNLYHVASGQRKVNLLWQNRLNAIGARLKQAGIQLVVIGPGDHDHLDEDVLTYLGAIDNERITPFRVHADAGLVLAQGTVQHNESSKIYEYIRDGLPVVSEHPVPNNWLIRDSGLGHIAPFGDEEKTAELLISAANRDWDREAAVDYMLRHHTWDARAAVYDSTIQRLISAA